VQNPGAQATKEAAEGVTGLTINYWALIDLKGFESLVDSVGGITMDVYRRVPIGGGSTEVHGYVEAGKNRHLSGYEALWFARSRSDSSDYDRIVRQKCVMNAMLNRFDPITVLTKFNKIAAASREVVATDIPTSQIGPMLDLALKARQLPVSSVAMMPPLIDPSSPDFTLVRRTVEKRIATSEAIDRPTVKPTPTTTPTATAKPKPKASSSKNAQTDSSKNAQTDDLGKVCAA
jgi:polyisoprenyl-teichoic acid--peptidoglycan teichoic acid transferase